MKCQVHERLFLSCLVMLICFATLMEPESLNYIIVRIGGPMGKVCTVALAVLTGLAFIDTVINDILPEDKRFDLGKRFRQIVWLLQGIILALMAFVIAKYGSGYWISAQYILFAAMCASVAFIDLHQQLAPKDRRATDRKEVHA